MDLEDGLGAIEADRGNAHGARFLFEGSFATTEALVAVLAGTGLHLGRVAILAELAGSDNVFQRELGGRTGIEKSSMVNFLDALETEGPVQRDWRAGDRRTYIARLTAEGAKRLAEIGPGLQASEYDFMARLTPGEQRALPTCWGACPVIGNQTRVLTD